MEGMPASREGELLAGKYRLMRRLGAGGMGEVYLAKNEMAGRSVAIKLLFPERAQDQEAVKRFLQEARAANRVRHPNVVDVIDVGMDERGVPYIVQELLEGQDFADVLEELRGRLSVDAALQLVVPVVEAIAAAHLNGVVHRDLKPSNVFLAKVGGKVMPKVLDFGIARVGGDVASQRLTATGIAMGTPAYMAPEVIQKGARAADPQSDVWSLGVMLYEVFAGVLPFEEETLSGLFVKICTEEPVPLEKVAPSLPPSLLQVVGKCLQKKPEQRYPDAGVLAKDLRAVQAGAPLAAASPKIERGSLENLIEQATLKVASRPPPAMPRVAGLRLSEPPPPPVGPKVDRDVATQVPRTPRHGTAAVDPPRTRAANPKAVATQAPTQVAAASPSPTPSPTPDPATTQPSAPRELESRGSLPPLALASIPPPRQRVRPNRPHAPTAADTATSAPVMRGAEIFEVAAMLLAIVIAAVAATLPDSLADWAREALGGRATLGLGVAAAVVIIVAATLILRGTMPFLKLGELVGGAGLAGYGAILALEAAAVSGRTVAPGLASTLAPWSLVAVAAALAFEAARRAWAAHRDERSVALLWYALTAAAGAIVSAHALTNALGVLD